jgi:all-trans-8'-apo-beta-carotenal 15,15'-oxygenase
MAAHGIPSMGVPNSGHHPAPYAVCCRYLAETQNKRVMFRGTFATQRPGGPEQNALDLHIKNPSNTNVVCWGGRLWSLYEAGQPYRLDPASLETLGLESLGGHIRPGLPFDLGSQRANQAMSSFVKDVQSRLGNAQHMPPELFNAGGWPGCAACAAEAIEAIEFSR